MIITSLRHDIWPVSVQGTKQEKINLECAVNLVFHFPEHEDIIDYVATMMN